MDASNPKRPCHEDSSSIQNPNSLLVAPSSNQNHFDLILSTLVSFPASSPSLSSPVSISRSLDRAVDKALASVSSSDVFERTLELVSLLHESTKRFGRNRATGRNSSSWPLPQELTIKIFSMLDTKSLMRVMACCTMFHKYAMDPSCYSHINLTTSAKNVNGEVVCTMIHRAGKQLRFLELGDVEATKSTKPLLKGACLKPLSFNKGFIGKCLRSIHLYNISFLHDKSSIAGLSACSNITDLMIVGMYNKPDDSVFKTLTTKCRFIEHIYLEIHGFRSNTKQDSPGFVKFLTNYPNLTSLALVGYRVKDATVQAVAESAPKLMYMDLSGNTSIKGRFLRDWGDNLKANSLETLRLRDCTSLEEKEVEQFVNSLSAGNFKFIRHIDISSNRGLLTDNGMRSSTPKFPLERLKEERPEVKFVADFTNSSLLSREERLSRGLTSSDNNETESVGDTDESGSDDEMADFIIGDEDHN